MTHTIVHLELAVEQQDVELDAMEEITNLFQQVLDLPRRIPWRPSLCLRWTMTRELGL
jgi:hypothetical protein